MFTVDSMSGAIAAAGALGTASFGIVEALKWSPLGEAGYGQILKHLGPPLLGAVQVAYGDTYDALLRSQYRQDAQQQTGIAKTLRQGVRIGLTRTNAESLAESVGTVTGTALLAAVTAMEAGGALNPAQQNAISRFEVAVDARIDAALSKAQDVYLGSVRTCASALAIGLSLLADALLGLDDYRVAFLVGVVAVPLAPISNDVIGALQAATKALRSR